MATTPDADVASTLDTALATLTAGTNLFYCPPIGPDAVGLGIPVKCVFVWSSGGAPPEPFVSGGTGTERRYSAVSIRVRSARDDYAGGLTLARSVRDAIHRASISGYITVSVRESDPIWLGATETCHEWSIGVELWHLQ